MKKDIVIVIFILLLGFSVYLYDYYKCKYLYGGRPVYSSRDLKLNGLHLKDVIKRYGDKYDISKNMYIRGELGLEIQPIEEYNRMLDSLNLDTLRFKIFVYKRRKENILLLHLHDNIVFSAIEWNSKIVEF